MSSWDLHTPTVAAKIGSIVVHVEEYLSEEGHEFDRAALLGLLADPEVREWLGELRALGMLPLPRRRER